MRFSRINSNIAYWAEPLHYYCLPDIYVRNWRVILYDIYQDVWLEVKLQTTVWRLKTVIAGQIYLEPPPPSLPHSPLLALDSYWHHTVLNITPLQVQVQWGLAHGYAPPHSLPSPPPPSLSPHIFSCNYTVVFYELICFKWP